MGFLRASWVIMATTAATTQASECSKSQALAAENEASQLAAWAAVHKSYLSYAQCDDGAIGEGYSESVTSLLANHWATLPSLAQLAARDPRFLQFVVRHIDETVPRERLATIAANARSKCPKGDEALCERIAKAAE
jgi:hypothetical protein